VSRIVGNHRRRVKIHAKTGTKVSRQVCCWRGILGTWKARDAEMEEMKWYEPVIAIVFSLIVVVATFAAIGYLLLFLASGFLMSG
jgi:hypothetical protein